LSRILFNKAFIISVDTEYFCGKIEQALNMKLGLNSENIITFEDIYKNSDHILDLDINGTYLLIYDPEFTRARDEFYAWRDIESKIRNCSFHYLQHMPAQESKDGEVEILKRVHVYNGDGTAAYLDFRDKKVIDKYPEIYEDLNEVVEAVDWNRKNMTEFWPYTRKY